ncbi:MAG: ATP-binding protein, partial [Bacillota bacterium]|nr:ATP-binding protein [Bacillota bacterium]
RVTFIAHDGTVLGDSSVPAATLPNHATREEVAQALKTDQGWAIRYSQTDRYYEAYYAVMLDDETVLRISVPLEQIMDTALHIWGGILIATAVLLGLGIIIAFGVAARLTVPLRNIAKSALQIASGDYDARIKLNSKDEMGQLAQAFNTMAGKLGVSVNELENEKNSLETLLSSMNDGVVAVDADMRLQFLNGAAKKLLYAEEAVRGKHILETVRCTPLYSVFQKALQNRENASVEFETGLSDPVHLKLSASPITSGGMVAGAVALVQDITQIRKLEKVRSEFVANVTHELKTPLTSIKGFTQTLMEKDTDKNTRDKFLEIIDTESDRLKRLIDDILTLSEIESRQAPKNVPTDFVKCCRRVYELMKPAAERKAIRFELDCPEESITVLGQKDRIEQMLLNLVDNAIKYTPEKGKVEILLEKDGENAKLRVSDNGIGMAGEHLGRIFERFYRADKGRSRALGGTGLGLAIVKHIALSMNGEVSVESQEGKGSTFIVSVPLYNRPKT